jgi:predicted nucleic acid-binding Zn ribbon protein
MAFRGKKRGRKKLDAPEALEELLDRAGEDRFAKKRVPIPVREGRAAVGPRIADRARPWTLERGVLTVKVATSVWANELQMLAPELVARLKARGFAVDSMRFRVGQLDQNERPPERRTFRKVPPPKPLEPALKAEVAKAVD